ncbi:BZ3500_MvSof-1268-A1-R1_Chr2-2g05037 [Microbotryum saponariae]|uniref:Endosomal/vacuolar adapter protein YPT35 n=1 Tax=Microbotryum saponariae TaxID=289078 RepID=A0A2X0KNB9_9BASI|nr:BZ3500_MvSof-1268-A1-R1_Chr2-2g05037 [Microbotryum saponariae]SDA00756.1 BZ3501_MvSof-1269-A2-R1_Chr2-2g04711 [Microbotryum saponariae]
MAVSSRHVLSPMQPTFKLGGPNGNEDNDGGTSSMINEATASLLHASLDIHLPRGPSVHSSSRPGMGRPRSSSRNLQWSRGSVEDLRAVDRSASPVIDRDDSNPRKLGNGKWKEVSGASYASGMVGSSGEHPFAHTTALLRRTHSADLLERDGGPPSEDDFSSDDEIFRPRPPSIASTNSQRSSVSSPPSLLCIPMPHSQADARWSNTPQRIGVLLEDCTNRENHAFARDVRITGFHPVGSQNAGGFVVFEIEIVTPQGTLIKLNKRYSAFVRLRADLVREYPHFRGWVPRLPPKNSLGESENTKVLYLLILTQLEPVFNTLLSLAKYRPSFLDRRRAQLAYWLTTILLHPEAGRCALVRQWVLE